MEEKQHKRHSSLDDVRLGKFSVCYNHHGSRIARVLFLRCCGRNSCSYGNCLLGVHHLHFRLLAAILSPVLGAVADFQGSKRNF